MCSTESRSACCCSSDWGLLSAHALAPPTVVAQCGESWRDLPARSFWFRAADHARLHGVELGAGTAGVVLAHENNGSLCEWLGTAKTLAEDGYHVLALDFRGFGLSPLSSHPSRLPSDLVVLPRDVVNV